MGVGGCGCDCVGVIATKCVCGWGSLYCCSKVCVCVRKRGRGESERGCVGMGVIVWV